MNVSVLIATYGAQEWEDLAWSRAWPSAYDNQPSELLCFHDPEGTIASVRNELANQAKSEWLCFLDADDELAPGYLDAMTRAAERVETEGPTLLTPVVSYVSRQGVPQEAKFWPECSLETGNWMVIGTLAPRDLFWQVGGFEEWAIYEDWALWARCWKAGAKPVKVPDAVYLAHRKRGATRNHALPRKDVLKVYGEIQRAVFG